MEWDHVSKKSGKYNTNKIDSPEEFYDREGATGGQGFIMTYVVCITYVCCMQGWIIEPPLVHIYVCTVCMYVYGMYVRSTSIDNIDMHACTIVYTIHAWDRGRSASCIPYPGILYRYCIPIYLNTIDVMTPAAGLTGWQQHCFFNIKNFKKKLRKKLTFLHKYLSRIK